MNTPLLAKSPERGGLTLTAHTRHVVEAVRRMAAALGFDPDLAARGAVLHDLGKAHPFFQSVLRGEVSKDRYMHAEPHRHEISSLLFLPLFAQDEWPVLVEMVAGHHKSVRKDRSNRGLLDLAEYDAEKAFERHAEAWDEWMPAAVGVARRFGPVQQESITRAEARDAFGEAVRLCEAMPRGRSGWRGLLMGADHFASNFMESTDERAKSLFRVPDLAPFGSDGFEASTLYPLSLRDAEAADARPHTLVVAPTGAGKTNFLVRRCRTRVFYTLPFQASINAMFGRFCTVLGPDADIRRLHSASRVPLRTAGSDELEEDADMQAHPGAGVKVLTPHQLASLVFGTPGHETTALDVRGQDVILDEVHTYSGPSQSMVLEIVRVLVALGCRVHVGTATIPTALAREIVAVLGGDPAVCTVRLTGGELAGFDRHVVNTLADDDAARRVLRALVADGQRVLLVANRVARAQAWYEWVRDTLALPAMLVHSRFRRSDRAGLEARMQGFADEAGPGVAVATQVVEVSLDVSFGAMVTDAAPLDALVQRFGRVNRRRPATSLRPVYVVAPPEADPDVKPYDAAIVRASYGSLPDGETLHEAHLQALIDAVYPSVVPLPINAHLAVRDGMIKLPMLTHAPRSALADALEIDGETGVLAADEEAYREADWDRRPELEIPLPTHLRRRAPAWGRIERGPNPLRIPDACYSPILGFRDLDVTDPTEAFAARSL